MTVIPEVELPVVDDNLTNLPDDQATWCAWPHWRGHVRRLDEKRFIAVIPFIYTHAVVWGWIGQTWGYEDRWCYHSPAHALIAATTWDGEPGTEPDGWHRHPTSGRRRPNGDPGKEYVDP